MKCLTKKVVCNDVPNQKIVHNVVCNQKQLCIAMCALILIGMFFFSRTKMVMILNPYSMRQPDLYYFETIKMTSQALSSFVWRIRAAGKYSL